MYHKPLFVLVVSGLILTLALAACGKPAPTAAPTSEPTTAPAVTEKPASGAVDNVKDAEKAVIRIVAEGSYSYPDFTSYTEMGSGSGFIIDPSGIAVTNNHVVTGAARIKVYFSDSDKAYNARILGVSECSDLAVIDIEGDGYSYLDWYTEKPELGLTVYSLGYPLGDPNFSRHKGEISKEKTSGNTSWTAVSEVLEHDAIINPGNSGGPLVTDDAKVVGVNYAGASQYDLYFSIPASEVKPVVEELRNGTNVDSLGINGEALVADDGSFSGIWVYSVDSGSEADKSGVKAGDFITSLEGIQLGRDGTVTDYCDVIRSHTSSDTLNISLIRFGTGEIMEGQINGRELKATGSIDSSSSSGDSSGTSSGSTTDTTTDTAPAYFTEEFDGDLANWSYFFFGDSENDFDLNTENGRLVFDISKPQTYVYVNYDPYTYSDVRIDAQAENMGNNDNAISLYCRAMDGEGWYEFNISSGGMWSLLRYDESVSDWTMLYNGGSYNINMGQGKPNTFSLICQGNTISAYINDKLMRSVTDYKYSEGTAGISTSSFDSGSASVGFNWVTISEP